MEQVGKAGTSHLMKMIVQMTVKKVLRKLDVFKKFLISNSRWREKKDECFSKYRTCTRYTKINVYGWGEKWH